MSEQIDWSKAPEGATHYFPPKEAWYLAGNGCAPLVWNGMWCKAFQFSQREHKCVQRPTTPSWSGEGLPPVGVVCEVRNAPGGWGKAVITHQGKGLTVWLWHSENPDQVEYAEIPDRLEFRPIRTPEQIAADEREAAIDEMLAATQAPGSCISLRVCEHLYDAGYRKEQK